MDREVWLRLAVPQNPRDGWLEALADAAARAETVLDVTASPGLFGGALRRRSGERMVVGPPLEGSLSFARAEAAAQAHVIEVLSAIGRERIDYYFARPGAVAADSPGFEGALAAYSAMRDQGHIGALGLWGDPAWLERAPFDWIAADRAESERLAPMGRRVLWLAGDGVPRLVTVSSGREVAAAIP